MLSRTVRNAVRQEAHVVYVTVALCVTIAGIAFLVAPKLYGAEGSVLVSPATFLDPSSTDSLPDLVDTIVTLGTSQAVLHRTAVAYTQAANDPAVAAARREQATESWLRRHIELRPAGTSSVLEVSARAPLQEDARDLAQAEMSELRRFIEEARPTAAARGRDDPSGLRLVILSHSRPQGWVSPDPIRSTLAGLAGGLIAGCALAVLLYRGRARPSPGRVATKLGVPWLGTFTPDRAARMLHGFLEGVAASQHRVGHVALVTGGAPGEAIERVALGTVRALNERATRGLLIDGELGALALRRRLLPGPRQDVAESPPEEAGDWTSLPATPPPAPLPARAHADPPAVSGRSSALARLEPATGTIWPEYEFVVLSGPPASHVDELLPLMGAMHCVVVLVDADLWPADLDALRALAREAEAVRAVVGVIGVTESDAQASNSS